MPGAAALTLKVPRPPTLCASADAAAADLLAARNQVEMLRGEAAAAQRNFLDVQAQLSVARRNAEAAASEEQRLSQVCGHGHEQRGGWCCPSLLC